MVATEAQSASEHRRARSFWLLYAVSFVEGADMQLLPSVFRALEADLGFSPTDLAIVGMCQALAQALTAPVWGALVDSGASSKWILVGGSFSWALLTFLLAGITDFWGMLVLRFLNGAALATLTPVSQAMIAELTRPAERGVYFGLCGFAMILGALACALFAGSIANFQVYGHDGWRFAFVVVALLSLALSGLLACLMPDVCREWRRTDVSTELKQFRSFCRIPTFVVITVQGCFGSVPWSALSFALMYFQYIGMRDLHAALLVGVFMVCMAFGHILGGIVGDTLTSWSRFHGRPITAQISVSIGTVLIYVLLVHIPPKAESFWDYAALLVVFGLTASWCSTGVNRPILTEVVSESCLARVVAWLTALEGSSAALLGAPLVGLLAEHVFGYQPQRGQVQDMPEDIRRRNASALAMGMLWMTILPWIVCFAVFSLLHKTYEADATAVSTKTESSRLV